MKLEITSGIHSKRKTKKSKVCHGDNTSIKIDGKEISENLNYFYMEIEGGEFVIWQMGLKNKFEPFKKFRWFLKRFWYKVTRL